MKKLLTLLACLSMSTASAIGSEAVAQYKASLTVAKIETSAPRPSIISKYLIQYQGLKTYNLRIAPFEFNRVVATLSTQPRVCKYGSFEYNLYLNKTLWEMPAIKRSLNLSMKGSGFRAIKVNEYGVTMWVNGKQEHAVTFVTKLTPFTYVNSVCKV